MQAALNDNTILDDKAMAEALLGKDALVAMEASNQEVPLDYFNQFEKRTLHAIQKNKMNASIFHIGKYARLAIAASFLIIAATTFIYKQTNNSNYINATALNIQEIPNDEIDAYVNANEWIAEIDWQSEINKEGANMEDINVYSTKDSNKNQQ